MNNENNDNLHMNYIENKSIDSIDDDFQASGKYLTFNQNTNKIGIINPKVDITKKNTKMSSNLDEDGDIIWGGGSENNYININENKLLNIIDINNIPNSDNNLSAKKSRNNDVEEKLNIPNNKLTSCENENNGIKDEDILKLKETEESINSKRKKEKKKLNEISKKKKKKKKIILLEEKNKYNINIKKNIHETEIKEEKEDKKIIRKDINGTPICKKNKKKVKISFERPFENVIPIESYKKYNVLVGIEKENFVGNSECQCCSLF